MSLFIRWEMTGPPKLVLQLITIFIIITELLLNKLKVHSKRLCEAGLWHSGTLS